MSEPGKTAPVWSLSLHNKIDDFTEGIKARNGTPEHLPEIGDGGYFDTKKSSVFFLKNGRGVQFAYADLLAQPGTPCPDPETLKQIASQLAKSIKL